MQEVDTPKQTACADVAALLNVSVTQTVKAIALMVKQADGSSRFYLALLRGDHNLNEVKLGKLEGMADFRLATEEEIRAHLNCPSGFIGPDNLAANVTGIADKTVAAKSQFGCGATHL